MRRGQGLHGQAERDGSGDAVVDDGREGEEQVAVLGRGTAGGDRLEALPGERRAARDPR